MKKYIWILGAGVAIAAAIYLINASWLASKGDSRPLLLAHRGVYQHYNRTNLGRDTCTAKLIFKPTHGMVENTLPSMRAALDAGADVVEIDIHPTTDGQFVVFHDWTVDCRTDGHGETRSHTLAELKALDIGYGYTYDAGKTFPFRGHFKGAMPSLAEVLTTFPQARFLINIKSNDPAEADKLIAYLNHNHLMSPRLSAYGGPRPLARLAIIAPELRPFSKSTLKACGKDYILLGWSGYMPKACRNTVIFLPQNVTWLAWGYPNRLQARFRQADSYIYLIGPHALKETGPKKDRVGLVGVNTPEDLHKVPEDWSMGILTDSIEVIGPEFKKRHPLQ